jgi:hypothetical protein
MIVGVGVGLVGWVALQAGQGALADGWMTPIEVVGLYWSFVDIVWTVLLSDNLSGRSRMKARHRSDLLTWGFAAGSGAGIRRVVPEHSEQPSPDPASAVGRHGSAGRARFYAIAYRARYRQSLRHRRDFWLTVTASLATTDPRGLRGHRLTSAPDEPAPESPAPPSEGVLGRHLVDTTVRDRRQFLVGGLFFFQSLLQYACAVIPAELPGERNQGAVPGHFVMLDRLCR